MDMSRRNLLQSAATLAAGNLFAEGPNDRIQVGFIGCGARAHELMQAFMQAPGAEVIGVVDAYKGRMERALDRVGKGAKAYGSYQQLLADKSIDAVAIVSPDHWHKQMVLDSLAAGKDIYCEKPLTYRSSEGAEIIAAAKNSGRIVQVGSQGVSSENAQKARELIRAGKIGKVTMIRAAYNRNTASGAWIYPIPPDASPETVDWNAFLGPAPKRPYSNERFFRWRCYKDYSGGIATDLFVHLCTTIHYLMDAVVPDKVMAMGQLYRWKEDREVPDTLNALLEYKEGFAANLSSTFNNQTLAESGFQFLGTEGTLVLSNELALFPERAREDNRWIVESWPKRLEEAYYKDPKVRATELGEGLRSDKKETLKFKGAAYANSNLAHVTNFVKAVKSRQPHWEDARAGHHAAACAHMVNASVETGRTIFWDFARDDIRSA
jgi:predicted dehydrogenase